MRVSRHCRRSTGILAHWANRALKSLWILCGGWSMLLIARPNSPHRSSMGLQSGDSIQFNSMSLLPYKLHEHNFWKQTIEINSQTHHNTAYTIGNIPWTHHCTIKLIVSFKWILYIIKENNQLEIRHHCMTRELETRWVYELLIWLTNPIIKGWKGAKGLLFKRTFLYCFKYLNMMLLYHTHLYIYIYCFTQKKTIMH